MYESVMKDQNDERK